MELRGRERIGALLVRHDADGARRAARIRAGNWRIRRGAGGAAQRGGVSARPEPVPPQEHRRGRQSGVSRLRLPLLLALRRAARARLLPAFGRRAGFPYGRGRVHFVLEDGEGEPSRWNTLRALRVLGWWEG